MVSRILFRSLLALTLIAGSIASAAGFLDIGLRIRIDGVNEVVAINETADYALSPLKIRGKDNVNYSIALVPVGDPNALKAKIRLKDNTTMAYRRFVATPIPGITFSATPTTITLGASTTLNWSTTNATSCTASTASPGAGTWAGAKGTSGSATVTPTTTGAKTYTLDCTGPGWSNSRNIVVTVNAVPVVNGTCGNANGVAYASTATSYSPQVQCSTGTPSTTAFPAAGSSQSWTCNGSGGGTNSPTCNASRQAAAVNGVCGNANGKTYAPDATGFAPDVQCATGTPSNTTFPPPGTPTTWTCNGSGGGTNSPTCSATHAQRTVSLLASTTTAVIGQSVTLTWSSSNVASCTASVTAGGGVWTGTKGVSGTATVTPTTTGTKTYTLNCEGAVSSTTVTVVSNDGAQGGGYASNPTWAADWVGTTNYSGVSGQSFFQEFYISDATSSNDHERWRTYAGIAYATPAKTIVDTSATTTRTINAARDPRVYNESFMCPPGSAIIASTVSGLDSGKYEGNSYSFTCAPASASNPIVFDSSTITARSGTSTAKCLIDEYIAGIAINKSEASNENVNHITWSVFCGKVRNFTVKRSCTLGSSNPVTIPHGSSRTAYSEPVMPRRCVGETRTCTDGNLSGTNQYHTCTIDDSWFY